MSVVYEIIQVGFYLGLLAMVVSGFKLLVQSSSDVIETVMRHERKLSEHEQRLSAIEDIVAYGGEKHG